MPPPQGLRPLPYRKVAKRLRQLGFQPVSQEGSHVKFRHEDGRRTSVPHHAREEIDRNLLKRIVSQGEIDPDEFFAAFR